MLFFAGSWINGLVQALRKCRSEIDRCRKYPAARQPSVKYLETLAKNLAIS